MKNLIITMGAIILILTISGYQVKCNKILHNKELLKNAADEGAATAALYFNRGEYAKGNLIFDKSAAKFAGLNIIKLNIKDGNVKCKFAFNEKNDRPEVYVELQWNGLNAYSKYEYVN